jgi:ribosomal protein S27E
MIKILKRIFETNPEKSKIILKEKCSGCGRQTIIEITPTSEGFGLQGGFLFKSSTVKYKVKCPDCIEKDSKISKND